MTNELKWLLEELLKLGLTLTVVGILGYFMLTRWLSNYLSEKGKNLVTKEDISTITELVKGVEHQYNLLLEATKAKQQMRMVAMDKRLQIHQEAFTLWRTMLRSISDKDSLVYEQCQDWWDKNCLYLEIEVRRAFLNATSHSFIHKTMLNSGASWDELNSAIKEIVAFGEVLFRNVQLPGLTIEEKSVITPQTETD